MNTFAKKIVVVCIVIAGFAVSINVPAAMAVVEVDLESGLARSGYNDVRYPGTTGSMISLSRDLTLDRSVFWRARLSSHITSDRHTLSLLVAPLRLSGEGVLQKDIRYGDVVFPALANVTTRYRFDSYRLTYRYDFLCRENFRLGIGFTGKIRDAAISFKGNGLFSEKKNTGFVPLANFRAYLRIDRGVGLLLEGDALAAPQGRAEDVLGAVTIRVGENARAKIGYRILEGGADNDEVYTFALVHYLVFGIVWRL